MDDELHDVSAIPVVFDVLKIDHDVIPYFVACYDTGAWVSQ